MGSVPSSEIYVSMVLCRDVMVGGNNSSTLFVVTNFIQSTPFAIEAANVVFFNPIQVSLFLAIYSEVTHEEVQIDISVRFPDGRLVTPDSGSGSQSHRVQSGAAGLLFQMPMPFNASIPGLYWIEAYIGKILKNKIPLSITNEKPVALKVRPGTPNTAIPQELSPDQEV